MKHIIYILLLSCVLISCNKAEDTYMPMTEFTDNSKAVSYGNHQDVYLFSNQILDKNTDKIMKQQFGYPFQGAQKERAFELFSKNFDDFEEYKKAKNIIFICNLDIPGRLSAFINDKLPKSKLEKIISGQPAILTYQNEWSDDQLVTFVLGSNKETLENIILSRIADLYLDYEKRFLARMTKRVYYRGSLDQQFEDYSYSLEIPSTFQLYKEYKDKNLISYIYRYKKKNTVLPDKFVTIYTEDIAYDAFSEDWIRKARSIIGQEILDGDTIDWLRSKIMPKSFITWQGLQYDGFVLQGAWENKTNKMGGTFKSYAIYDAKGMKAYLIDTAVYYPAGTKIPFITELEGIAKSFIIKE